MPRTVIRRLITTNVQPVHEVALATQLSRVVGRAAAGRRVAQVNIEVGALRQVVPDSLTYAWIFVIRGTELDGAKLHVDWIPAEIECAAGHRTRVDGERYLDLRCPNCPDGKNTATRVVAGEEFRVIDLEVE